MALSPLQLWVNGWQTADREVVGPARTWAVGLLHWGSLKRKLASSWSFVSFRCSCVFLNTCFSSCSFPPCGLLRVGKASCQLCGFQWALGSPLRGAAGYRFGWHLPTVAPQSFQQTCEPLIPWSRSPSNVEYKELPLLSELHPDWWRRSLFRFVLFFFIMKTWKISDYKIFQQAW